MAAAALLLAVAAVAYAVAVQHPTFGEFIAEAGCGLAFGVLLMVVGSWIQDRM